MKNIIWLHIHCICIWIIWIYWVLTWIMMYFALGVNNRDFFNVDDVHLTKCEYINIIFIVIWNATSESIFLFFIFSFLFSFSFIDIPIWNKINILLLIQSARFRSIASTRDKLAPARFVVHIHTYIPSNGYNERSVIVYRARLA